jgi:hypothetical protein
MHPDLDEPAFAKWYTSDLLVKAVAKLLDCDEGELQMGKYTHRRIEERLAPSSGYHRTVQLVD